MTSTAQPLSEKAQAIAKMWLPTLVIGILMLILGVIAIGAPNVFTLAIAYLFGGIVLIWGLFEAYRAYSAYQTEGSWGWSAAGAALAIIAGILLLVSPAVSAAALTIILIVFFLAEGTVTVIYALRIRPLKNWPWVLASGVCGIAVGLLIWAGWPSSAAWAIGLLIGIRIVVTGLSLILIAIAARAARKGAPA